MSISFTGDYGDTNGMMSCLCAVYSRMAYLDIRDFINVYSLVFNKSNLNAIPNDPSKKSSNDDIDIDSILSAINTSVIDPNKGLPSLIDDNSLFTLEKSTTKYGLNIATTNGKKILQYIPFSYRVNLIIGDERKSDALPNCSINDGKARIGNNNLVLVNITDSNYGDIYVFGDKRMPNIVNVAFRGTASIKSAGSYSRPSSLKPKVFETWRSSSGESYSITVLGGIFKILNEIINTILSSIDHVAKTINGKADVSQLLPNTIKVITTGHSLGGALATLFAFKYVIYPSYTNNRKWLDKNIGCFSLGSPRIFGKDSAIVFCCLVRQNQVIIKGNTELQKRVSAIPNFSNIGKITFLRITTYNDPIPALPKAFYRHPCSYEGSELNSIYNNNESLRKNISQDCLLEVKNPLSTRCARIKKIVNTNDYTLPLNCMNIKRGNGIFSKNKTGPFFINRLVYHIQYLAISFAGGVDLTKSIDTSLVDRLKLSSSVKNYNGTKDLKLNKGDTIVRFGFYPSLVDGNNNMISFAFFDLVPYRDVYSNDAAIEAAVANEKEDGLGTAELNAPAISSPSPYKKGGAFFTSKPALTATAPVTATATTSAAIGPAQIYPEDVYVTQDFFKTIVSGLKNKKFLGGTDLSFFNNDNNVLMNFNINNEFTPSEYNPKTGILPTPHGGRNTINKRFRKNTTMKKSKRKNKRKSRKN